MTSRRARIKGIANIPARRKNDAPNSDVGVIPEPTTPKKTVQPSDDVKVEQPSPQKTNKTTESNKDVKQLSTDNDSKKNCIKTETSSPINSQPSNLNQSSTISDRKSELAVKLDSNNKEIEVFRAPDNNVQCADITNQNETQGESVDSNCEVPKGTGESCTKPDVSEKTQEGPKFARRWVPRPAVKIPAIARRSKPVEVPTKESPTNQNIENEEPVAENNDVISNVSTAILSPPRLDPPATLTINKLPSTPDLSIKIPAEPDRTLASPLSPSKTLNRTRIRPSPKLVRRNSVQGSASESEDDGRRSRNRIRNDSVCSITSYTTESTPVKDHVSAVRDRINACYKIHKLFRRSEQTRKVAEARREFYQKFGTAIPDKKRLTMMDLIYYNPTSNPMPKKESRTNNECEIIETIEDENPEEENEDEPDETNADEDATPVPQVKVGPNGEIILDEQSLVIEQTGTKKGREKLANSQIVNVDDLDRTYGIYKRPKRAKDWNVVETLRFYKTLNTVGTDFSLMLSLFPGRTRRELKIKFKKEEKINRALIDKALMNPVEFDFTELEQQLVADELALAADKEEKEKRKQKGTRQKKRKSASALAADMEEENVDDELDEQNVVKKPRKEKDKYSVLENGLHELLTPMSDNEESLTDNTMVRKSRPSRACRRKSKYTDGEDSEAEEEDEDTNNNETSIESEKNDSIENEKNDSIENEKNDSIEVTINKQTINNTEENDASMIEENEIIDDENMMTDSETTEERITNEQNGTMKDSIIEENSTEKNEENSVVEPNKNNQLVPVTDEQNCAVPNILPNDLSTVEPGSLMILSSLAADGQQVFKVFMVTPGQTKVPVNLSPDVVESLRTSLGTAEAITLDLPVITDSDKPVIPDSDSAVTT